MKKADVPLFVQKMAKRAPTFADLAEIASAEVRAFNGKAEMVCGPITTGGAGNTVSNLLHFNYAIELLQHAGRPVWSQMPYEAGLSDLEHTWRLENPSAGYCDLILTEFYAVFLNAENFKRAWFLPDTKYFPGWKSSKGAIWEWNRFNGLGIETRELPEDWLLGLNLPKDLD